MTTLKDVASYAKVSPSTVSRVLSGRGKISSSTQQRVLAAVAALNYHPNIAARGLAMQNTQTIGVVIAGLEEFFDNNFFIKVIHGISSRVRLSGYDLLLSSSVAHELDILDGWINGGRVDGLIFLRSYIRSSALERLMMNKFPAVLIGSPPDTITMDFVDNDNIQAAYEGTSYLIQQGHRQIGFLGGSLELRVTRDRLEGYRNALRANDIRPVSQFEVASFCLENGGYMGAMKLLANWARPTAIIATDDILALGAMRAAYELGYSIPRDLSLVGFNNIPLSPYVTPPLTTIDIGTHRLGELAAELLLNRIHDRNAPHVHHYERTRLIIRESCAQWFRGTSDVSGIQKTASENE